jgi:hypothetical protein
MLAMTVSSGRQVERGIRQSAIPNADSPLRDKLDGYARQYEHYLNELAAFQEGLLKRERTYIKKKFLNEPQTEPKREQGLLARVATLEKRITQLSDKLGRVSSGDHEVIEKDYVRLEKEGFIAAPLLKYVSKRIAFDRPFKHPPKVFLMRNIEDIEFNGGKRLLMECIPVHVTSTDFQIQLRVLLPMRVTGNTNIGWVAIGE